MGAKEIILDYVNDQDEKLCYIAKEIWDHPQVALQETFASALLAKELEADGFNIEWGVGQMPTAFVATWGQGSPIIGFLGEYDALPGLSQRVHTSIDPIEAGGPGHGCGHNLFGTACMASVMGLKRAMEAEGIKGTIRFYGCPAEETLVGKTYMAKDGAFDDLDAAISWHPGNANIAWNGSALALNSFKVNFYGVASHAGGSPHLGRSALDGVMLMDMGVNYLREHIMQEARIHCVVTSGGQAPNVVPAFAQVWYFVRAPHREQVDEIYERVLDIAKGAALMSGTTHEIEFLTGCYDLLPNDTLSDLLYEKMKEVDDIQFTEQERTFARELQATFPTGSVEREYEWMLRSASGGIDDEDLHDPLWEQVIPHSPTPPLMGGSTEVGDVSWITPTGQITTTCWPLGTPGHSWQTVVSSGSSIGNKGMLFAAKAMGLAGWDLLTRPDVLAAARVEFDKARRGKVYVSPLPEGAKPR
ncbi:MAG: amidohydrolase [Ardenticatenaceae bacterium]|nr:amidohydrolase [Ardenticatenaceae bacterium]